MVTGTVRGGEGVFRRCSGVVWGGWGGEEVGVLGGVVGWGGGVDRRGCIVYYVFGV